MADKSLPIINKQKCNLCGQCVDVCPEGVLEIEEGILVIANPQNCTYCTTCEEICPEDAVRCDFVILWG